MAETKHEKFIRLAEARVPKALDAIRLVGQLSSANYHHEKEEAEEIVNVLAEAVVDVGSRYRTPLSIVWAEKETPAEPDQAEPEEQADPEEEEEISFPPPIRFTTEEMRSTNPVDPDEVRAALQALTYSKDMDECVRILREALTKGAGA